MHIVVDTKKLKETLEVVSKISTLAAANAGTNENVIKEQLMKAVQGMKL